MSDPILGMKSLVAPAQVDDFCNFESAFARVGLRTRQLIITTPTFTAGSRPQLPLGCKGTSISTSSEPLSLMLALAMRLGITGGGGQALGTGGGGPGTFTASHRRAALRMRAARPATSGLVEVDRKTRLASLLSVAPNSLRYNDHQIGMARPYNDHQIGDGPAFHRLACGGGLEGIVSKRTNGRYEPDRRTWLKVKCLNREEFVVVG